jgi:hypothetical protein
MPSLTTRASSHHLVVETSYSFVTASLREAFVTLGDSLRLCASERLDGGGFVGLEIENGCKSCHLQQIVHSLARIYDSDLSSRISHGTVSSNEFPETSTIDVTYSMQINQNLVGIAIQEVSHHFPQFQTGLP